jgi:oxygen-independent coproporphyrinogen-3 oxidase
MAKSPVAEREQLNPEQRAREQLVFGLRMLAGVKRRDFQRRTGFAVDELVGEPLREFVRLGLLDDDGERIMLTRDGLLISDALWPEFL